MPVQSSEALCDALRSITCSASDQQQQLGTVNAAALVLRMQGACMHCFKALIHKDLNNQ